MVGKRFSEFMRNLKLETGLDLSGLRAVLLVSPAQNWRT